MNNFKQTTCAKCKEIFYISPVLMEVARRSEQMLYCPHGHQFYYPLGPTDTDLLRQERDRLKQQIAEKDDAILAARAQTKYQREQKEAAERRASAARGQVTKIKNRVGAGTCPCCNRTFQQLASHMANKHPTYRTSETLQ